MSEAVIIAISFGGAVIIRLLSKKFGYKFEKMRLKRGLRLALDLLEKNLEDSNKIKKTSLKLQEFDFKHNTSKLNKVVDKFLSKNPHINEKNLKFMIKEGIFSDFSSIYDQEEIEELDDDVFVEDKLSQIEQKRQEIIQRKQKIKTRTLAKIKIAKRQNIGAMG